MKKLLFLLSLTSVASFANNVQYDVFVDFDNKLTENLQLISSGLYNVGIDSLYKQGYVPHLTLYLTEYKEKDLSKIKRVVDHVAKETKPFSVKFTGMHATAGNWLMLDTERSKDLQQLSDHVVEELLPVRAKDAVVPDWAKNIPAKVEGFQKFGSPNVFENFDPHVTLLTPASPIALSQFFLTYPFAPFSSKVKGIGITKADPLGQSKKIIYYKEVK